MFKIQLSFTRDQLTQLFASAVNRWSGGSKFDSVTINCDSGGRASGYAFLRKDGKTTMVNFSHEVIVAGISLASALAGNPIADNSLVFTYHEGRGYGSPATISAVAETGTMTAAEAASALSSAAGKVAFPATVTVTFSKEELPELLKSAVRRAGHEPVYAVVSYSEEKGTSASISVKTKGGANANIALAPPQLIETLTEELTARGYSVLAGGFKFTYSAGGHGSGGSGTSVSVSLSALPL